MFNKKWSIAVMMTLPIFGFTQQQDTVSLSQLLEEVQVKGVNAGEKTPISYTNLSEKEIDKSNLGQDLPYLISLTPSVVSSSDAGAGIGYTYMTIRGSDANRINVTINGIPLNDSESQGVWWVNMPDFSSSVNNIQIQRGVGTSTNGGSAFGATVNLQTNGLKKEKYFITSNTLGSFNTLKNNIEFGTGLLGNNLSFDGRISKITSDGYIDRSSSDLESFYLSAGYYGKNSTLKAILFDGHERTYQAWNGVPQSYLDSNRKFNPYNYENEVDDYGQTHFQLHYNKQCSDRTFLNLAIHYTKGSGYYEQYKGSEFNSLINYGSESTLSDYGISDTIINGDTISTSNLIRRKWLDNDFYGATFSFNHSTNKVNFILGGAANTYNGAHFGKVIFTEIHGDLDHEYYRNDATKNDLNLYLKTDYAITNKLNVYLDLQTRFVDYTFEGFDANGEVANQTVNLRFFNPKYGIFYSITDKSSVYSSYSEGKREPNRNDYIESTPSSRPSPETLFDTEVGYRYNSKNFDLGINLYNMEYKNQLVNTGEINDVGASINSNIDESYRRGVEIETALKLTKKLSYSANITFSKNKIASFTEYIDNWDTWSKDTINYKNTDISFSPNIIAKSQLIYDIGDLQASWIVKHIGNQFMDNSQSEDRMLEKYTVNNLLLSYVVKLKNVKSAKITLLVNNFLNTEYVNRAWVYRFNTEQSEEDLSYDPYINIDSDGYNMIGYFPQASRNYLLGVTLGF
ncbi:MAG: TonB-dependent receptor [Flavobacteriales bacterium]|nr:TonB-dependent receptor [Flavobacteriales bacterium]|tara:strand:- start:5573 stop:7795 length:2223 start_codon:yes stop_codon:yes gene_type:complete